MCFKKDIERKLIEITGFNELKLANFVKSVKTLSDYFISKNVKPNYFKNKELFKAVDIAVDWLKNNDYSDIPILKWRTDAWGEIPADYGRK